MSAPNIRKEEQKLLDGLVAGDRKAFQAVFVRYYPDLVMFAGSFIPQKDVCEDIVQDVFVKLLDSHGRLQIRTSLKAYLLGMVHNRCLGVIEHGKVEKHYLEYTIRHPASDNQWEDYVLYSDFASHLEDAMGTLSEKEKDIFVRCLIDGCTPKDVSEELTIPLRTVQYNLQKAIVKMSSFFRGIGFAMLAAVVLLSSVFVK